MYLNSVFLFFNITIWSTWSVLVMVVEEEIIHGQLTLPASIITPISSPQMIATKNAIVSF